MKLKRNGHKSTKTKSRKREKTQSLRKSIKDAGYIHSEEVLRILILHESCKG